MATRRRTRSTSRTPTRRPRAEQPDATEDVFAPNPAGEPGLRKRGHSGERTGHHTLAERKPGEKRPRRSTPARGPAPFERQTFSTETRASGASPKAGQKKLPRKSAALKRAAKKGPGPLPELPPEDKVLDKRLKSGRWRPTSRYSEGR